MGGQEVRFWADNWVPGIPEGHPTPPLYTEINKECKVVEVIDPISREWNTDFLSNLVLKDEQVAISHIHVGPVRRPNKLVWPFERNDSFSVKFGYRWCYNCHPTVNIDRPSFSQNMNPRVWDWVWSCKAPPKLGNFLWRAFFDACATKFNLYRRRCAISPLCPICAEHHETVEHILLLCPWASRVWKDGPLSL